MSIRESKKKEFWGEVYKSYFIGMLIFFGAFLVAAFAAASLSPAANSSAQTVTVENRATGYFVTVTSPDVINLSVDATPTGQVMVAPVSTVNVTTNAPSGYKLYISASNANLTSSGISQSFSPVTTTSLTNNTWGYSLDTGSNKNWYPVPQVADPSNLDEAAIIAAGATDISPSGASVPNYPNGTDIGIYYGINSTTDMPSGTYSTTITYTAFGEGIPAEDITGATYLQDVTLEMCNATDTGVTAELKDKRGYGSAGSDKNTTYTVVKARDGNCWMADNLRLYNVTIAAADSDFTSGSFTIPASSNWSNNEYSAAKVHIADGTGSYADKTGTYYGEPYYNWCAATAQTSCGGTSVATTSICPNGDTDGTEGGFKLPLNGDANTNYSYAKLLNSYSVTTGAGLLQQTELGFARYYGYWGYGNSSEYRQGSYGYFWSATPSAAGNAYNLGYYSGGVYPQNNSGKGYGFSVRCVVR